MNVLNKLKRGLAALLSLSVAMSAVFVFHFPLMKAYAAEGEHEHSVDGKGDSIKWTAWPPQNEEVEEGEEVEYPALPDSGGYYYLTADVEIDETWKPADGTYLCLNGKKITMTGNNYVVSVSGSFTLCNCNDKGTITHNKDLNGGGVKVSSGGTFNMYGGAISGNKSDDDGAGVQNRGTFNMYGGEISGNTFSGNNGGGGVWSNNEINMYGGKISGNTADNACSGGGVYNNSGTFKMYSGEISNNKATLDGGGVYNISSFEMYGGKITGNTADGDGGGVYLSGSAKMTVGGTPNITGNKSNESGSANENNVFLPSSIVITISKSNPLWGTETKIGVTNEIPPTESGTAVAYAENGLNYRLFFIADHEDDGRRPAYPEDDGNVVFVNTYTPPEDAKAAVDPKDPQPTIPGGNNEGDEGDDDDPPSTGGNPALVDDHFGHKTWKEISSAADLERKDEDSYYYVLTQDVDLGETWTPANGTVLCLNGKTLSMKGSGAAISVPENVNFSLCDCEDKNEGAGAITNVSGEVVKIDGGDFSMYSGKIFGGSGVIFTDNGGTITVGGKAKILNDVVLPSGKTITVSNDKPLEEGASIYVSTADTPTTDDPVVVTGANGDNEYSGLFHSINANYEFKTNEDGKIVLAVKKQEDPKDHKPHGENDASEWKPFLDENGTLPTDGGYYFLTNSVTIPAEWEPAENTYICLNGQDISGTIGNSNVTLCDCTGKGTATVTVSDKNTITVGGKLKANITLSEGAHIAVDSSYALRSDASITVTLGKTLAEGGSEAITTANGEAYEDYFHSGNPTYNKTIKNGEVWLERPEAPAAGHTHPICGDVDCRNHIAPDEWTAWTETAYLPETAGYYFLVDDVKLFEAWNPADDTYLCLNGHSITLANRSGDPIITIAEGADFTLCDCAMYPEGSNTIVNNLASATNVSQVNKQINDNGLGTIGGSSASGVENNGSFTMFGGVIKNNGASGVHNSSDFVMRGGVIIDNSATNGGGVFNRGISSGLAIFTMEGGVIAGNTAAYKGGGLYNEGVAIINDGRIFANKAEGSGGGIYQDGTLTVDHGAYITGNTANGKNNNVYILAKRPINIGTSLSGTVGVTLENAPTGSGKVEFASGSTVNSNTLKRIKSDNSSYTINQSKGTLTLSKKASSDDDDDDSDWELDILRVDSSQIPQRDRTAIIDMLKTMPDWVVGAYFDVTLYEDDEEVSESARLLDVEMTIPSSIRAANRAYKVIRVHDGKAALLDDIDSDPNTVTVRSRYFSTYAIIYSVSKSGSANGASGSGSGGGYGNPTMGVQNDIPIAGLACGFTVLALAAPGKKLENV